MPTSNITRNPFTEIETPAVGVTIENLSKKFGSVPVLHDISFSVEPGEIVARMGASGSGKSVLVQHTVGPELPTRGRVTVDGRDASNEKTREEVRMALVFQAGALFNSMTVYDNLALYPREHRMASESGIREKVMRALQILSLDKSAKKITYDSSICIRKIVANALP